MLSTEVLVGPADDRQCGKTHPDDEQPPANRKTEEDDSSRGSQRQWPPAVGAEEPVLPLGGRDRGRRVVFGAGVQLAAGLPEVEADQGREAGAQEQPERPNRLV